MADNYLEFSQVLPHLTTDEETRTVDANGKRDSDGLSSCQ